MESITNVSEKEVLERISAFFEERWFKNQSYGLHRLKEMKSQPLSVPPVLKRILLYTQELSSIIDMNSSDKVPYELQRETLHWEQKDGFCIYMSVLIKALFSELDKKNAGRLVYYQGYSDVKTMNPFAKMVFGERQFGLHAWLTFENRVIDPTASQHNHSITFEFGKLNMVLGKFPKEYRLTGFKETDETIAQYIHLFATQANKSEEEWLESHLAALAAM